MDGYPGDSIGSHSSLQKLSSVELVNEVNRRCQELSEKEKHLLELEERLYSITKPEEDVLEINAGGQVFATRRRTICLATDSVLAALFSGKWDDGQQRDSQGRPFLDIDPYIFDKILNFLRQKAIEGPDSPAPIPVVTPEKAKEFECVVEYYGLTECLFGPKCEGLFKVQTFSRSGEPRWYNHSEPRAEPRGYAVRLRTPIILHAVLIGARSPVQVVVGCGSDQIIKAVLTEPLGNASFAKEWRGEETTIEQVAKFDITLHQHDIFIMAKLSSGIQCSYLEGDNQARDAGPFSVESKCQIPPQPNTYSLCMRIVYKDAPDVAGGFEDSPGSESRRTRYTV